MIQTALWKHQSSTSTLLRFGHGHLDEWTNVSALFQEYSAELGEGERDRMELRVVIPRVTHSADRRINIALRILRRDEVPNLTRRIRRHGRVLGISDDGKERPRCMYQGDPGLLAGAVT